MDSSESSTGVKWNVAVDGSDMSQQAFDVVFDSLRKEEDYITVSHVFSNAKDYLSHTFFFISLMLHVFITMSTMF